MRDPPLRNRTVLALAEVVAACFDFMVNVGGRFEPRARPDLLGDFLYAYEYPQPLVAYARQLQPRPGVIKDFVLGLDIKAGQGVPIGILVKNWDEAPGVSERLLRKLASDILHYASSGDALVKPAGYEIDRLGAALELDGYEYRNDRLVLREENVFDVEEQVGTLRYLFAELGLEGADQFAADLRLTDEHYTEGRWGDAVKHARDVMEIALRGVARARSATIKKNLGRTALPGAVRAFLKDNGVIDEVENEFLFALYGLLSVQGGHPNMSEREHARICRQYALTATHFVLLRWQSLNGSSDRAASEEVS